MKKVKIKLDDIAKKEKPQLANRRNAPVSISKNIQRTRILENNK